MLRGFEKGSSLRQCRIGVNQVGGCIDCAAGLTRVTILVLGVTLRTLAFDVAIRQKHAFDRIIKLFDFADFNESGFA